MRKGWIERQNLGERRRRVEGSPGKGTTGRSSQMRGVLTEEMVFFC